MEEEINDWPLTDFGSPSIKLSELIAQLQEILNEHGDLPVYSTVDYGYISSAEYKTETSYRRECVEICD